MDKCCAHDEPKINGPRPKPDKETAKIFKLLEEGESEVFPGFNCSVQSFLNQVNEIKFSIGDVPDCCMNELLRILMRSFPKGNKLEQFSNMDKVNELFRAQMLMHDLKSQGGDAGSSTQVPNAVSGQEILRISDEGDAKPVDDAAKSGKGKGKGKGKAKTKARAKGKGKGKGK